MSVAGFVFYRLVLLQVKDNTAKDCFSHFYPDFVFYFTAAKLATAVGHLENISSCLIVSVVHSKSQPQQTYVKSGIFAHVELTHVEPMREKIFFVNYGDAPKAHFWRDRHVTLTRPRFNVLAFIWIKSGLNRTSRKGRSGVHKVSGVNRDRRTDGQKAQLKT